MPASDKILAVPARDCWCFNLKTDPQGVGYNFNQSKIAVGSGEWFARALLRTQTQLNFVPENSRDFIFTAVGGRGSPIVAPALPFGPDRAAMWAVFAQNRFSRCSVGLRRCWLHMIVNIGMTIDDADHRIPLPFMSYAGSALITTTLPPAF